MAERTVRAVPRVPKGPRTSGPPDPCGTSIARVQQRMGNQALQRLVDGPQGDGGPDGGDMFLDWLDAERGTGSALPIAPRSFLESELAADLSGVRVHADAASDALAKA